ncbi:MAG: nitroreductase family protein [Cyclobacteriaceae bacterium]|nr:nitroreductase family protein [Cyclobacteriaceae bacterium]
MKTKTIQGHPFIEYKRDFFSEAEVTKFSKEYLDFFEKRRTVRDFSNRPVPLDAIENIIQMASTAPSGAHKQPWHFCVVSNPDLKKQIRAAAEKEEYDSYHGRMNDEWVKDLEPLGTDWHKPFLEIAPYLIIVFKKSYNVDNGQKSQNYYVNESVGIACGFLLTAIHQAGLVALTHTPSPMNFLSKLLERPTNEKPFLLVPVGYPAEECYVPDIKRKPLDQVMDLYK